MRGEPGARGGVVGCAPMISRVVMAMAVGALVVGVGGCQTERRVVAVKGGWSGLALLPGAQSELPKEALAPPESGDRWNKILPADLPGKPVEGRPLRRELDDGSVYLVARSPKDVIVHLYETLQEEEYELLEKQVLAERTKKAYQAEGKNPREAVAWLVRNKSDVEALIGVMPAGEQTPGVFMNPIGQNAFRLTSSGLAVMDLRYKTIDVVLEEGKFRLLMIR